MLMETLLAVFESQSLEVEPRNLHFRKHSRSLLCTINFENYCSGAKQLWTINISVCSLSPGNIFSFFKVSRA